MEIIKRLLESGTVRYVLGVLLLFTAIGIISFLAFTVMYWTAKKMADADAKIDLDRHKQRLDTEYERYKDQLTREFEDYKNNLQIDTTVNVTIEKGVGYTESREHRIKRIV